MEENELEFNFWPSFADLMLALVLVLMLVLFMASAVITAGTVNLSKVDENQKNMVREIADAYHTQMQEIPGTAAGLYGISIENNGSYDIVIKNEPTLQRITFSEQILFQPNDDQLNERGVQALTIVGEALKKKLSFIREIQIQGHADPDPPARRFGDNLNLAAARAITVFKFFQDPKKIGIDPAASLMSITSFGQYKPVQRSDDDREYSQQKLDEHNGDKDMKAKNRRIELLLFYRLS